MRKRIFTVLLCCLFCLNSLLCFAQEGSEAPSSDETKIECGGFDTPEEAVLAFCEALKENDFQKAVSTFAIESYCEHFDLVANMQRLAILQLYIRSPQIPIASADNETSMKLSAGLRAGNVLVSIYSPMQMIALDHAYLSADETVREAIDSIRDRFMLQTRDLTSAQLQLVRDSLLQFPDFSQMSLSKPISPLAFGLISKNYLSELSLRNFLEQAIVNGASGVTELGVIMENDEDIYLVTMNIVKYGDKWYNCSLGGDIAIYMGQDVSRKGLFGAPKSEVGEQIKALTAFDFSDPALIAAMLPELTEFRDTFDQKHAEYVQQMQSDAQEFGLVYDPDLPWLSQLDVLRELAEKKGEKFYSKQYIAVYGLTFDEMLEFFSEEELTAAD